MNTEILIALNEQGQLAIQVRGPASQSKVALLGMLEMAKNLILHPPEASPIALAREIPNGSVK